MASSWARMPETPITRQTFSCTAMSMRIETRIAKAKAAPSWAVKVVVWVMKPGPMALVAIRNMAPISAVRRLLAMLRMLGLPVLAAGGGRGAWFGWGRSRGASISSGERSSGCTSDCGDRYPTHPSLGG